jgi:hypothetical protein
MKRLVSVIAQRPSVMKTRLFWLLVVTLTCVASGVNAPHLTSHLSSQPLDECRQSANVASLMASPCIVPCVSIQNCPAGQDVREGTTVQLSTSVPPSLNPRYNWTLTDVNGQDRSDSLDSRDKREVSIDTRQLRGDHTARVDVTGFDSTCTPRADSCRFTIVSGPLPCPSLSVSCPDEVEQGDAITFVGPSAEVTFNWSVSAGTITSGQGTSTLTVDTANLPVGSTVTATLSIGGVDPGCSTTAACTTRIRRPKVFKFDEYAGGGTAEENQRLDKYAMTLLDEQDERGFIVAAGTCAGEGETRAARIKAYLVNSKGIDPSRLSINAASCRREPRVQLWLLREGTPLPQVDTEGDIVCRRCLRPTRRRN